MKPASAFRGAVQHPTWPSPLQYAVREVFEPVTTARAKSLGSVNLPAGPTIFIIGARTPSVRTSHH